VRGEEVHGVEHGFAALLVELAEGLVEPLALFDNHVLLLVLLVLLRPLHMARLLRMHSVLQVVLLSKIMVEFGSPRKLGHSIVGGGVSFVQVLFDEVGPLPDVIVSGGQVRGRVPLFLHLLHLLFRDVERNAHIRRHSLVLIGRPLIGGSEGGDGLLQDELLARVPLDGVDLVPHVLIHALALSLVSLVRTRTVLQIIFLGELGGLLMLEGEGPLPALPLVSRS